MENSFYSSCFEKSRIPTSMRYLVVMIHPKHILCPPVQSIMRYKNQCLALVFLFLSGCLAHREPNPFPLVTTEDPNSPKTYSEFLSLIEQSESWMKENFERKQFLIVKSPKQEMILHPRIDLRIREQILQRVSEGSLLDAEKDDLLSRCATLHDLWQKQRKRIQLKRFQLGLTR